ncbi:tyrosine-type recombinase/integrase [Embleya sp. NPDC005575]|uniref:tyrosine-type recombinase/integrase n=1 Tax=Embleya sp. NPDC005575 TaxID=3156892 RepID=UPI0033A07FD5
MAETLEARRVRQNADREAWGDAWVETGRVFTREDGSLLHPSSVTDRFVELTEEAGLPPTRLHDLRHLAATLAHAAGASLRDIQELLGHSSTSVTEYYVSVFEEAEEIFAAAVVDMVPRAGSEKPEIRPDADDGEGFACTHDISLYRPTRTQHARTAPRAALQRADSPSRTAISPGQRADLGFVSGGHRQTRTVDPCFVRGKPTSRIRPDVAWSYGIFPGQRGIGAVIFPDLALSYRMLPMSSGPDMAPVGSALGPHDACGQMSAEVGGCTRTHRRRISHGTQTAIDPR